MNYSSGASTVLCLTCCSIHFATSLFQQRREKDGAAVPAGTAAVSVVWAMRQRPGRAAAPLSPAAPAPVAFQAFARFRKR